MKRESVENAITNIDDRYIFEALEYKKSNIVRFPKMMHKFGKVAAITALLLCVGTASVYAAATVIKKKIITDQGVIITDHAVSVGNPDYVDDDAISSDEGEVTIENKEHVDGDETVNWLTKDVQIVNGDAVNTYYRYTAYETAVADFDMSLWFSSFPGECMFVTAALTETPDTLHKSINASYQYKSGEVYLYEDIMTGNVAEDVAQSVVLKNTSNIRQYTNVNGRVFTLVDEKSNNHETGEEVITTYVMLTEEKYFGYISFAGISEDDMHEILDMLLLK